MSHKYLLVFLVLLLMSSPVSAAQTEARRLVCPICHRANDEQAAYAEKASATLIRGALNTAFGWTELLAEPTAEVNAGGNILFGIGKGMGFAIKRTATGLGELLTFWTPKNQHGKYLSLTTDCPICFPTTKPESSEATPQSSPSPQLPNPPTDF